MVGLNMFMVFSGGLNRFHFPIWPDRKKIIGSGFNVEINQLDIAIFCHGDRKSTARSIVVE
jgi:hypothetical protein